VWLASAFDVYVCEVNGSAKLIMPDNSVKYVGYAGKTGRPYVGLGMSLVQDGVITRRERTLGNIQRLYERDPELVQKYIDRNENMVFFSMYDGKSWPSGSLGVPVTSYATLATDKRIFPRGLAMFVDTQTAGGCCGRWRSVRSRPPLTCRFARIDEPMVAILCP